MDANRSLRVSFDLYVWGANGKPHPRDVVDPALLDPRPVASKWVPQSIADQIWMLYEFATPEDRDRHKHLIRGGIPAHLLHLTRQGRGGTVQPARERGGVRTQTDTIDRDIRESRSAADSECAHQVSPRL